MKHFDIHNYTKVVFATSLLIVTMSNQTFSQVNQNFVIERVYQQAEGREDSVLSTVTYVDGLGRTLQTVQVGFTPNRKDLVQPVAYDALGREVYKYLPYATSQATGQVRINALSVDGNYTDSEQYLYHNRTSTSPTGGSELYPYAHTVYEVSSLNRTMEQGAPGASWQPTDSTGQSNGHTQKMTYDVNGKFEVLLLTVDDKGRLQNSEGELNSNGFHYYSSGTLNKTTITSENWQKSDSLLNTTEEFKDLQGKVVLRRTYVKNEQNVIVPLETYYAYDDFGLLRYVIPPKAVRELPIPALYKPIGKPWYYRFADRQDSLVRDLCYYYAYDEHKRMTVKQLPGADSVLMVYDGRDRLVLTQDGNMRDSRRWIFTKYDDLNRPLLTGVYTDTKHTTQAQMQGAVDSFYVATEFAGSPVKYYEVAGSEVLGYTNKSFPSITSVDNYLTVTIYDDYDVMNQLDHDVPVSRLTFDSTKNISTYIDSDGVNNGYFDNVRGQVTCTVVKVLDGNEYTSDARWLATVTYYDDRYRPIQVQGTLYDGTVNGGTFTSATRYHFNGQVERIKEEQTLNGTSTTVEKKFTYDYAWRVTKTEQRINDAANWTTISELAYNELGQLVKKKLGNSVQTLDYRYNIRGWLTQINDPDTLVDDLFDMKLLYDNPIAIAGSTPKAQYNGNISEVIVNRRSFSTSDTKRYGYGYTYDVLNRLTSSNYGEGATFADSTNKYTEYGITYDLNGNFKTLNRKSSLTVDSLEYKYSNNDVSNQLLKVIDASTNAGGFMDNPQNTEAYDFLYDKNGNLAKDLNKGIDTIRYNLLNLPYVLSKDANNDSNSVKYIYSATGVKLCKEVTVNDTVREQRYYCSTFEYDSTGLSLIHHEEGIVEISGSTSAKTYNYEYFLRDHLGNTRIVINSTGGVLQRTDYYPFGLIAGKPYCGNTDNKYLFGGKELQDDDLNGTSLDVYDFVNRTYDPQLGRFWQSDPLAEQMRRWSTYAYCFDNPMRFIDPDGMKPDEYQFDSNGQYKGKVEKEGEHYGTIASKDGKETTKFSFADPVNDPKAIEAGEITKVVEVSDQAISKTLDESGVNDKQNQDKKYDFIQKESNAANLEGSGKMDYVVTAKVEVDGKKTPISNNALYITTTESGKVAHNNYNFGNFLWGAGAKSLGIPQIAARLGAHYNNYFNDPNHKGKLDSKDDQHSISLGYEWKK